MNTLANGHRLANVGQLKGTDSYNPELMAVLDEIKELKKQGCGIKSMLTIPSHN